MKYDISKTESFSAVIAKLHCGSASEGETKTNKQTNRDNSQDYNVQK